SLDSQLFHVVHGFQLQAFGPAVGRPGVEQSARRTVYGTVHIILSTHGPPFCQTLSTRMSVISSVWERPAVKLWLVSSNFCSSCVAPALASERMTALTPSSASISPAGFSASVSPSE